MAVNRFNVALTCPRCGTPHGTHRLTCRRCGEYMHDVAPQAQHVSAVPGILFLILVVVLIGGFACFSVLKSHVDQLKTPPAAEEQAPAGVEDKHKAEQPKTSSRKTRHKHHRAH